MITYIFYYVSGNDFFYYNLSFECQGFILHNIYDLLQYTIYIINNKIYKLSLYRIRYISISFLSIIGL